MNLTPKDLQAIEIWKKYHQYSLEENLKEYHSFLDALIFINETLNEKEHSILEWQKLSETLLFKFCFHGFSVHSILSGIKLKSNYYTDLNEITYIDTASSKVILRSQLETFLMYHHIYVNPDEDSLKQLRYYAWIYSGLIERQKIEVHTEFAKSQKQNDLLEISRIQNIIQKLEAFQMLTPKQQNALLSTGSGKLFQHWSTIIKETGFKQDGMFDRIYYHLSVYSHSEGISAIQIADGTRTQKQTEKEASMDVYWSKILVSRMVTSLIKLFPITMERFVSLPIELQHEIEIYSDMSKLM